jgi:hypothetical protein
MELVGEKQDKILSSINDVLNAGLKFPDKVINASAQTVDIVWSTYKKKLKSAAIDKITIVRNLANDLTTMLKDEIENIGATKHVEKLVECNNEIKMLLDTRLTETASRATGSTRNIRNETDGYYRDIIKRVGAFIIIESIEPYQEFVLLMNATIAKFGSGKRAVNKPSDSDNEDMGEEEEVVEEMYPDSREWTNALSSYDCKNGDVFYVVVDNVKKYFRLKDRLSADMDPTGEEGHLIWDAL